MAAGVALCLVLAYTSVLRLFIGQGRELWFDEVWTGVIAGPTSWHQFLRDCYLEASPPLYYLISRVNEAAFGSSNDALRLPSLAFGLLAPIVALFAGRLIPRNTRFVWCALIASWTPGLWFSHDARPYAMLLFLAAANTIAYAYLLARTGTKYAAMWLASGAVLTLTHYFAGFLVLTQGLFYLAVRRQAAVRTWPALLVFAPVVAWLCFHAPRMLQFGDPAFAAYRTLNAFGIYLSSGFVLGLSADFGLGIPLLLIAPTILLIVAMVSATVARQDFARWRSASPATIAAVAALAAFCLVIVIACVRPILVDRYLTAFVPGILLGISIIVCRAATRNWVMPAGLAFILAINLSIWRLAPDAFDTQYNFQVASDFLAKSHAKQVTFYWDHPLLPIEDRSQLKRVSSFFFDRAHKRIDVEPAFIDRTADPNPILAHDIGEPGTAVIWIYNTSVPGTTAARFSPRLPLYNPDILCHRYGFGVLACVNQREKGSVEAPTTRP